MSVLGEPFRGIEGIEAWRWGETVRVSVSREAPPGEAGAETPVGSEWARQVTLNPRLFNGPVLSVVCLDVDEGHVSCRRESYQRLVVQPRVATGVRMLAVTGVLIAKDERGRAHVLLGQRAPGVRVYGGQWELGPSGGVPAPPGPVTELGTADLVEHLADEVLEEVGLEVRGGVPVAVVRDLAACSDDLCLRIDVGRLEDVTARVRPANWEYTRTRWVAVEDLPAFDRAEGAGTIAATRALWRVLGWVD